MTEKKKVELEIAHTSCKSCCFAVYDGITQTQCQLGRLDKYRSRGEQAVVEAYDNDREFYIVNGAKCPAFRNQAWADKHPPERRVAEVRKELTLRVDTLVFLDSENASEQVVATVESLKRQKLAPHSVWFLLNHDSLQPSKLHLLLRAKAEGLVWTMTQFLAREGKRLSREAIMDDVSHRLSGHFYTSWPAGSVMPVDFLAKLDQKITDEMARFAVVLPEGDAGLTVALGFHRAATVNGNAPGVASDEGRETIFHNLLDKVHYFAETHEMPWLVTTREELFS